MTHREKAFHQLAQGYMSEPDAANARLLVVNCVHRAHCSPLCMQDPKNKSQSISVTAFQSVAANEGLSPAPSFTAGRLPSLDAEMAQAIQLSLAGQCCLQSLPHASSFLHFHRLLTLFQGLLTCLAIDLTLYEGCRSCCLACTAQSGRVPKCMNAVA